MKIAVLVSGGGSNLSAIKHAGINIDLVLTDRKCGAIKKAYQLKVPVELVERTDFTPAFEARRDEYTHKVLCVLIANGIELVILTGFKTILSPVLFMRYADRVLNIHPSLLPLFKGAHAVRDALEAGVEFTGTTVHVATPDVDDGRILRQEKVMIREGDNIETLADRIKQTERRIYPTAIKDYIREITRPQTSA